MPLLSGIGGRAYTKGERVTATPFLSEHLYSEMVLGRVSPMMTE